MSRISHVWLVLRVSHSLVWGCLSLDYHYKQSDGGPFFRGYWLFTVFGVSPKGMPFFPFQTNYNQMPAATIHFQASCSCPSHAFNHQPNKLHQCLPISLHAFTISLSSIHHVLLASFKGLAAYIYVMYLHNHPCTYIINYCKKVLTGVNLWKL